MIESITLQNFKSFGEEQTIPLEPITVLVGPNNSGKSNFMSVARFLKNGFLAGAHAAVSQEGDGFFHTPGTGAGLCNIEWQANGSSYICSLDRLSSIISEKAFSKAGSDFERGTDNIRVNNRRYGFTTSSDFFIASRLDPDHEASRILDELWDPFVDTKFIKLSLGALRADSEVVPNPGIGVDGRGIAAVVGLWRGAIPEKVQALNGFLSRCLPEMKEVLVRPAPVPGHQRLWFRQNDGLAFDAEHVSDGVLAFTALAMHALSAEPGQLLCIEEPEQSIHPKRLRELVDLLKDLVRERGCQFIIATHSTVLLNAFRDEPEAILLFRRSDKGTRVKRLSDVPELVEALQQTPPGDLLETGAFSTAF
ncbi:hypothetical protein D7Y21_36135 [Corallococcus sp. AB045]|uniref:AAA family ATPase n=1 Tax=Corallococcus sp. AB045 TaxID=2316719 RepID=UPI000ED35D05|nr:ATP-binding protein [Corallococcus sp. AB045]RKH78168.1 hypothetical protein D7Y21_36135 [Corallococcus sp. AB045]